MGNGLSIDATREPRARSWATKCTPAPVTFNARVVDAYASPPRGVEQAAVGVNRNIRLVFSQPGTRDATVEGLQPPPPEAFRFATCDFNLVNCTRSTPQGLSRDFETHTSDVLGHRLRNSHPRAQRPNLSHSVGSCVPSRTPGSANERIIHTILAPGMTEMLQRRPSYPHSFFEVIVHVASWIHACFEESTLDFAPAQHP